MPARKADRQGTVTSPGGTKENVGGNDEGTKASEPAEASKPRSRTLRHGVDAAEAGRRSGAARRARAAERAAADADAATTFRQRLGVSLSRLSQDELDAAVKAMATEATKGGKPAAMTALAKMADQAFGKPAPEEEDPPGDELTLTRAQRSALIARILEEEDLDGKPSGDGTDPRDDPPSPAPPHPPE